MVTVKDVYEIGEIPPVGTVPRYMHAQVIRQERFGKPAEEILLEAEAFDADLIALATSDRGRLRRALLPGVAQRVARQAPVPTLVLHEPGTARR